MFGKFITFIFIPKRTGRVKKVKLSLRSLSFLFALMLGLLGAWGYVFYDYLTIRSHLVDPKRLITLYNTQQKRIKTFRDQQDKTEIHFKHVESIYSKLKQLTQASSVRESSKDSKEGPQWQEKLQRAQQKGILSVIASDISEIDSDQKMRLIRFEKLMQFFNESRSPLTRIPWGAPVKGYMISEFGVLQDSFTGRLRPRHGILIATRAFSPLYATADGVVRYAGADKRYGKVILIDHTNGVQSKYGYVSALLVHEGEVVRRRQKLAEIQNTQRTSGPQLYYETSINGVPVNPIKFINPLALKD